MSSPLLRPIRLVLIWNRLQQVPFSLYFGKRTMMFLWLPMLPLRNEGDDIEVLPESGALLQLLSQVPLRMLQNRTPLLFRLNSLKLLQKRACCQALQCTNAGEVWSKSPLKLARHMGLIPKLLMAQDQMGV